MKSGKVTTTKLVKMGDFITSLSTNKIAALLCQSSTNGGWCRESRLILALLLRIYVRTLSPWNRLIIWYHLTPTYLAPPNKNTDKQYWRHVAPSETPWTNSIQTSNTICKVRKAPLSSMLFLEPQSFHSQAFFHKPLVLMEGWIRWDHYGKEK